MIGSWLMLIKKYFFGNVIKALLKNNSVWNELHYTFLTFNISCIYMKYSAEMQMQMELRIWNWWSNVVNICNYFDKSKGFCAKHKLLRFIGISSEAWVIQRPPPETLAWPHCWSTLLHNTQPTKCRFLPKKMILHILFFVV